MTCMFVVTLVRIGCSKARKKDRSFVAVTILNPSTTSPKSRAALTREREFKVSSRRSKSSMAGIHGSPTSESRMREASAGGIVTSESRLESGFSIRRRLFSLLSMSLLRSCNSEI
jgi:hypothetical protein